MTASVFGRRDRSRLRLSKRDVLRGLLAGAAFAVLLTAGLAAMTALSCGGICLPEVGANGVLALAGGVAGIGPLAAYGRRWSMIPKSGNRFSEKIMLKQEAKA
jgi:hypothetical protein